MNKSTRLQVRMSKLRDSINELPDDAPVADRDALTSEYTALESQFRSALITESDDLANGDQMAGGEGNEVRGLLSRIGVGDYLSAAMAGRTVDGGAAELRAALLGDDAPAEYMPIDLLLPELRGEPGTQMRADAATSISASIQENQSSIAARVFPAGALDYLSADRPTVSFGTQSYVSLTAGATADFRDAGVAKDAEAATFTTKSIDPSRISVRYVFDNIGDSKMRGSSDALATDLRGAIAQELDLVGLQGQAVVSNTSPAVVGIIGGLVNPTTPTAIADWEDFLGAYDNAVDGRVAMDDSAVRLLVNVDTWKFARKLQIATSGDLLRDRLPVGRFRVSSNMPPTPDSGADDNIATALTHAAGPGRGFTQAIWRGVRLIRDVYTKSSEDQTAVTAVVYVGQDLIDAARYGRIEFKLA